ncbi:terminase large subunit domain-containing protein [Burkholderia glumae]|uniref:terminase large subunit domain-containing protein n=1 Tax=Burkholderia glumae TaxID=337 RepID=UPI0003A9B7F8|nr:terminase family protein [Burkholderia glumae]MCM2494557.1 terminase family protein [Burkholderia glumae]
MTIVENRADRSPAVLLPYQQKWCADASPVKVCEKSRRVGLTWGEAADSALLAASKRGMDVWYVGYNKDMAQEFIRDCADWAKFYRLAADEIEETEEVFQDKDGDKSILAFVIRFASGFRVTALSSRPSNLRGKQGRVIIDEAAFHDQLGELLKAAMALLMWGGQVHIISTHDGVDNAFNELVMDVRSGKKPYSLHRITFADAVRDGLYQRICLRKGETWTAEGEAGWVKDIRASYGADAEEELDCVPKNSGGAWLSRALIESRMSADTPVLRWACKPGFEVLPDHIRTADCRDWLDATLSPLLTALPPDARSYNGEDFGRTGDLTVHVPLIEQQNLVRRVPFIVELRNVPFRQQEQIAFYLLDRLPRFTGGAFDARGNGQYLAEVAMQRYGASRIQQVMLSESWYREHMPPVKAALEDGTLDGLPKDADVLADLRAVQVIKGVARIPETRTTGQDEGKRHGDAAVAVALAYFASRELNTGPVTVQSRRRRASVRMTEGYA